MRKLSPPGWSRSAQRASAHLTQEVSKMRTLTFLLALSTQAAVMPLSLKRAVEIATSPEGSARVQIANELIKQAEARRVQARSALLPNFDASVSDSSNTRNL